MKIPARDSRFYRSTGLFRLSMLLVYLVFLFSCKGWDSQVNLTHPQSKASESANIHDTFLTPQVVLLSDRPKPKIVRAGKPVIVQDLSDGGVPFFARFTTSEGLALNSVLCSMTDKMGNLWFGTGGGGVSRFDGRRFESFTISQGLASNVVFSAAEDEKGNLWFGTSAGVSKYDGFKFTNFTTSDGLAGNLISAIVLDKKNNIWFGTQEGGVSKYDGKNFKNYSAMQGLGDNYVQCLLAGNDGTVWIGTGSGGLSNFDGSRFKSFTGKQGLSGNSVNNIFRDRGGNLWCCTENGISKYDGKRFINLSSDDGLKRNKVQCMGEDDAGNLWIGTMSEGISKYDGKSFTNYSRGKGLDVNNITSITKDKNGHLWFTSIGEGIFRYGIDGITNFAVSPGFAVNLIFGINQDRSGNLWFGTNGGGVSKYDGKDFEIFTSGQGIPDDFIWCSLQDRSRNIWLGTNKAGVCKYDGRDFVNYTTTQGLVGNSVTNIFRDRKENIWFCTLGGASKFDGKSFTNYTTAQGLPGNNVLSIIEDDSGNIWFTTHDNGVSKFDGKRFTNYTTADGLAANTVYAAVSDKHGILWFGTNKGVSRFDGKSFSNYTIDQGLADDYIWAIAKDTVHNIIWLGTNRGLAGIKQEFSSRKQNGKFTIETFNEDNGYSIKEVNAGALFVDKSGMIWIGSGHNELIRFDYSGIAKKRPAHAELKIQNIKVENENVPWSGLCTLRNGIHSADSLTVASELMMAFGKIPGRSALDSITKKFSDIRFDSISRFYSVPSGLVLPHKSNSITIEFAAIEPASYGQMKYQYLLEGYSRNWSTLTKNSSADFGNMPAGNYIFRLKALNPSGIWSETAYAFKVLSPWWVSWWAYLLYGLTVLSIFYAFYLSRIRVIQGKQTDQLKIMVATQEEERRRIARDLHDEVGVKLSALKLSLSSLSGKETADEKFKLQTRQSEELLGEAMQDVRRLLNNLSPAVLEEFGYATAVEGLINKINQSGSVHFNLVLFGMKQRLKKDYELTLFRITQELVNNVLKHAHATRVSLQVGHRDGKIILMIEDDGNGFDVNSKKEGYGLHNLEMRTSLLKGNMMIDSHPGKGTSVVIEIPYNFN